MFLIPGLILALAVLGGVGYEAVAWRRARRAAHLQAIRDDPADWVRARINGAAPKQLEQNRKVEIARTNLTDSEQKVAGIAKDLPADPPPRKWVIIVLALAGLWVLSFTVQFLLDFRVAKAITGNTGGAALTSLVLSGLLSATSLVAALLWERRSAVAARVVHLGLLASAAVFFCVLSVVVLLAPKRAELDFADRINAVKQSIAMYQDDNDSTAVSLEQTKLGRLEEERDRAATYYQAVAVAAGVLEAGSSLAVPSAYILINYFGAQALFRRRRKELTTAEHNVARRGERFAARISRQLERAGVSQDQLGALLNGGRGQERRVDQDQPREIGRDPRALPGAAQRPTPPEPDDSRTESPGADPGGNPPQPAGGGGNRSRGSDDGSDPSFDQA